MSKRVLPQTSLAAHASVTISQLNEHYSKISECLLQLKTATAERIAHHTGLTHVQVNRRIVELERKGIVWRPGGKMPTSTGRMAMLIQLSSETEVHSAPFEKANKDPKTVAHYSKKIKELSTPFIQPSLF